MNRKQFLESIQLGSSEMEKENKNLVRSLIKDGGKITAMNSNDDYDKFNNFIVGGEVVYVNKHTPARQKQDLLVSKLLAQLYANKTAGSKENTEIWYKAYTEVLENIGFAINKFGFQKVHQEGASVRVDKALIELLIDLASDNEIDALKASLEAIKSLEDEDGKVTLFSWNANSSSGGKFQISSAKINSDGNLETTLGAYYTQKNDTRGNFLWFSWGSLSFEVWFSGQRIELDEEIFSDLRSIVLEKVGKNAKDFIQGITI